MGGSCQAAAPDGSLTSLWAAHKLPVRAVLFTDSAMSPRSPDASPTPAVLKGVSAICHALGDSIRSERRRRRWTMAQLAVRAGVSTSAIQALETGERGSLEIHVRIARALGLELRMELIDPRQRSSGPRGTDLVHAGMGEVEVAHLRGLGYGVGVDEPYQHFQFAGRADVVAWDLDHRALLHIENRTRFPDIQAAAGALNAKRDHLAASIARRLGLGRFASQTMSWSDCGPLRCSTRCDCDRRRSWRCVRIFRTSSRRGGAAFLLGPVGRRR